MVDHRGSVTSHVPLAYSSLNSLEQADDQDAIVEQVGDQGRSIV